MEDHEFFHRRVCRLQLVRVVRNDECSQDGCQDHVPVLDETGQCQTGLQGVSLVFLGDVALRVWRRFGWIRTGRFTQLFAAFSRKNTIGLEDLWPCFGLLARHHPDRELCHYDSCRPLIVRCESGLHRHHFEISCDEVQARRRAWLSKLGPRRATSWGTLNFLGGRSRCFLALRCFIAFSFHCFSLLWARLARFWLAGRDGRAPPRSLHRCLNVISTMRSREYVVGIGPWRSCWVCGLDAMTHAANLDLHLTAFWRHLCGDAFRRQSTAPSDPEGRSGAALLKGDALVQLRRRCGGWHLCSSFASSLTLQVLLRPTPWLRWVTNASCSNTHAVPAPVVYADL